MCQDGCPGRATNNAEERIAYFIKEEVGYSISVLHSTLSYASTIWRYEITVIQAE